MIPALILALLLVAPPAPGGQTPGVLHIKVVLTDADGRATPVPRHALLISQNPAGALPRRVVTGLDGTVDVQLRAGNYTVESDRPTTFNGKAYQWTLLVDVVAGRDQALELTAANADVEAAGPAETTPRSDASFLLNQWQGSVVAIWTPITRATGFVIDAKGLVATSQRSVGVASSVEVQLTQDVKVGARVLAADAARNVAVLWVNPAAVASVKPVPTGCTQTAKPAVAIGQEIVTISSPLRGPKGMTSGTVSRVDARAILADFVLGSGRAGGPVFTTGGELLGLTLPFDDRDESTTGDARVVRIDDLCAVLASADTKMTDAAPPETHLPVEPTRPFPFDALKKMVQGRAGNLNAYQASSADFDLAFITPVHLYGVQYLAEQARDRDRSRGAAPAPPPTVQPLMDFGSWSEYVADLPPVLLIRVTPKMVEGFWTTVARGAAQTQGVALPPMKRLKSPFSRLRAFCGDAEVTPIHPFQLEHRVSETDAMYEGLYVFDPAALGPHCSTVKLVLYSTKEPTKGDSRVIDPKVLEQIWQDFEPYRAGSR